MPDFDTIHSEWLKFYELCAILVIVIGLLVGVFLMKKLSSEQRDRQILHSMKAMRRRKRNKKRGKPTHVYRNLNLINEEQHNSVKKNSRTHVVNAPKELSILLNLQGSIEFFNEVFDAISKCMPSDHIYFNFKNVELISADALMYVIAILTNNKKIQTFNIMCGGNEPENKTARQMMSDVGFYKYVKSWQHHTVTNHENIQITKGEHADGALAARVCDFVRSHIIHDVEYQTKQLYPMIIELMTNTKQHAYNENGRMFSNWYIYVENKPERVQCIFLDTGTGIPNTIRKTFTEKLVDFLAENDARYISSALRGEFRTETKMPNRGKGLPEIYEKVKSSEMCCLNILSGKGLCVVSPDGSISEVNISNEFIGTLFVWEILKQE